MMAPARIEDHSDDSAQDESVCGFCPEADNCRKVWSLPRRGPFSSAGLSVVSAVVFLVPLASAITGGALAHACAGEAGKLSLWEIAATGAGLILGIFLARAITTLVAKRVYDERRQKDHCRH